MEIHRTKIPGFSLLSGGLVLCGIGLWLLLCPAQYQAVARIEVEPDANNSGTNISYDPYFIQTEFEVLQSQVVLGKVVEALNLNVEWGKKYGGGNNLKTSEAIVLLKRRMHLRPVRNTRLIEISVTSEDPNEAAHLANAIAKSYRDYRLEVRKELIAKGIEALERQYQEDAARIRVAQTNLDLLRDKYNIDKEKEAGFSNSTTFSPLPKPTTPAEREELQKEYERTKPFWEAKRELATSIEFHNLLAKKIEFEKSNLVGAPPVLVQVTDAALPPKSPIGPDRILGALLFCVGVFPTVGGFLLLKSSRRQFP